MEGALPTEFIYRDVELYRSVSLGTGSYGWVCKAKCDGLLCAAKILHPALFDLRDPGTPTYLRKFIEECHLLSLARHPNVVQYLGTWHDRETRLPVLLMELCEESLTALLERSPGPLPYHVQIDICHDIALALVYLHANDLIHRDLTGNNVLMAAGPRAKITDFGMSKLASVNPCMTQCPGNILYMSPEALDNTKSYTAKLDVFSFGVIIIQILTRQFPKPTDRFRTGNQRADEEEDEATEEVRVLVPETECRETHLKLISHTHPLKPLTIQCLKKERHRPWSTQLSERLSELRASSQYRESRDRAECNQCIQLQERIGELETVAIERDEEIQTKCREIEDAIRAKDEQLTEVIRLKDAELQLTEEQFHEQCRQYEGKTNHLEKVVDEQAEEILVKSREVERLNRRIQAQHHVLGVYLQEKEREIESKVIEIQEKEREVETKQLEIESRDQIVEAQHHELQLIKSQLQAEKESTERLQRILQQKDATIEQLEQRYSYVDPLMTKEDEIPLEASGSKESAVCWRKAKSAPVEMYSGSAVAHGTIAYFRPARSVEIYSFQIKHGRERWRKLPDNKNEDCALAVINGVLTSIGGCNNHGYTNVLLSLRGEWSKSLPSMPSMRSNAACVATEELLVVAGGLMEYSFRRHIYDTVEVLKIQSNRWMDVSPALPLSCWDLRTVLCGGMLYLGGGLAAGFTSSNSVFACYLSDLILHKKPQLHAWREICNLSVVRSTLVSDGNSLLAIGGRDDSDKPTSVVYRYNSDTDTWSAVSELRNTKWSCMAVCLQEKIVVVGGLTTNAFDSMVDTVEVSNT